MVYPLDQISGHARIDINITQNTIAGHHTHTHFRCGVNL